MTHQRMGGQFSNLQWIDDSIPTLNRTNNREEKRRPHVEMKSWGEEDSQQQNEIKTKIYKYK